MKIALAAPRVAATLDDGLDKVRHLITEAAAQGAQVVCFPEAYLPGLRGLDFDVPPFDRAGQEHVVRTAAQRAREHRIAVVLGMEWHTVDGRHIAGVVLGPDGDLLGVQTK